MDANIVLLAVVVFYSSVANIVQVNSKIMRTLFIKIAVLDQAVSNDEVGGRVPNLDAVPVRSIDGPVLDDVGITYRPHAATIDAVGRGETVVTSNQDGGALDLGAGWMGGRKRKQDEQAEY